MVELSKGGIYLVNGVDVVEENDMAKLQSLAGCAPAK